MDTNTKVHDLTMLFLDKNDSTKDLYPKELVEKYIEVELEIKSTFSSETKKLKTMNKSKIGL